MATLPLPQSKLAARIAIVEQHVRFENQHGLEGVIGTLGRSAEYQDSPWAAHYIGRDEVRLFYAQLMAALPDRKLKSRGATSLRRRSSSRS